MQIPTTLKFLIPFILLPQVSQAAQCSRVHSFSDGAILTASQLNAEFGNTIDCVNAISDANISSTAAIAPKKISSTIAGSGITRNSTTGALSVSTDDITIETVSGSIRIKDSGVTAAKLKSDASVDANRAVTSDHVRDLAINSAKIADGAVTALKLKSDASVDANRAVTTDHIRNGAITQAKRAALPSALSSASGIYGATGGTGGAFSDVPNQSVSIVTTGRPVVIEFINTTDSRITVGSSGASGVIELALLRDGTQISNVILTANIGVDHGPSNVKFTDYTSPSDGLSHVYKIQARGTNAAILNVKTLAYEL